MANQIKAFDLRPLVEFSTGELHVLSMVHQLMLQEEDDYIPFEIKKISREILFDIDNEIILRN